jgi:hypothetical protein
MYQNYPNPFNPTTNIKFDVAKKSLVKINVYDVTGRVISELVNQELTPGKYEVNWNGAGQASGVYFYKIETGEFVKTMRMILVK